MQNRVSVFPPAKSLIGGMEMPLNQHLDHVTRGLTAETNTNEIV